jgi:hypothetical protein
MKQETKQENFLKKAIETHGDKYNYSNTQYLGPHIKIRIICPDHGEFEQTPDSHVRNHGCPKCNGGTKITIKDFLVKSKEKHGNKYGYSKVKFTKTSELIKINCPEHGEFEQIASNHLFGYGCQTCGQISRSNKRTKTIDYFIEKALEVHGVFYDYSKVKYEKTNKKVDIVCPKHGLFKQTPNDHISNKNGCPICNESKGEREIAKWLDQNNIAYIRQHKFLDCKDIRPLPFDFYLPNYNTCIEYDGEQHFKEISVFNNKNNNLLKIKKRDKIKTDYCNKKENPNLIRVKFDEINKINEIFSCLYS